MTPATRTLIYTLALIVLILGLAAGVIFGATDLDTAQSVVLWVSGLFGLGSAATAVANRPTKPPVS